MTSFGLEAVERRETVDRAMVLELPTLPPSTNNLYMNVPGKGRVKTQKYRDWLHVSGLILRRQVTGKMRGRVDITIKLEDCHPTRDADNTLKPCCDLLKAVGAITDDRSRFVRSVKAEWANVNGLVIEIERAV